ncbi:MAG: M48 family metallopeptidase [Cyanobacteria bacterium P01_H01_bin.26]
MKYTPREIVNEVNITPVHPLVNFGYLVGTVMAAGIAIYMGLGVAATQIALRMGPAMEAKVGDAVFNSLFAEANLLEQDGRLEYLRPLAESLRSDALLERPELKLHILDETIPNAMVSPGGHIFVTTGLLDDLETENELAFILSHELGHYENRDALRGLGRSLVLLSLNGLLGLSGVQLPSVLTGSLNLADLHYSRDQERRADIYAIEITHQRYGHLGHALGFFERLSAEELDLEALARIREWQSTHPLTQSRIEDLEALAEERGWALEGKVTPIPEGLGRP